MNVKRLLLAVTAAITVMTVSANAAYRVVGYLQSYEDSTVNLIPMNDLTHILFAFGDPTSNGTLNNDDNELPGLENTGLLRSMVYMAHAHGVRAGLAIGGWDFGDGFSSFASSPSTFVSSVRKIIDIYNLDGVDIDWEYPTNASTFNTLMSALRTEMNKDGKFLSIAVAAYGANADGTTQALGSVDFINIMAYDGATATDALNYWTAYGAAKLNLGLEFAQEASGVPGNLQTGKNASVGGFMCWDIGVNNTATLLGQVASATGAVSHPTFLMLYSGAGTVTKNPNKTAFDAGGTVTLTAAAAPSGYKFAGWSGDASGTGTTATLDMSANKTASAVYIPTASDSLDIIAMGDSGLTGTKGSGSTVAAVIAKSGGTYSVPYTIGSGDNASIEITADLPEKTAMTGLTDLKVTYKSDNPMMIILDQANLSNAGTSFLFYIEPSTNWRTVVIPKAQFVQPAWAGASDQLNLALDSSITFSPFVPNAAKSFSGTFQLKDLVLYGVKTPVSSTRITRHSVSSIAPECIASKAAGSLRLTLSGFALGEHVVSIYSVSGRELFKSRENLNGASASISLGNVTGGGVFLVRVSGSEGIRNFRINGIK